LLAEAEIVFAHLDNSRANQIFGPKNFVFTQQLLGVLDLAKAQQRAREADQSTDATTGANGQPHEAPSVT
jgi:3-hydroxyacyl-[acyl-carrier-protein] dehydratase